MSDSLRKLTTKELRALARDRGFLGAQLMGRSKLLRCLRGQSVLHSWYFLPFALAWRLSIVLLSIITQTVLLPFKAARWLFTRPSKTQPKPTAPKSSLAVPTPAVAPQVPVREPNVSLAIVRVREVVIRETSIVQVSHSSNDGS